MKLAYVEYNYGELQPKFDAALGDVGKEEQCRLWDYQDGKGLESYDWVLVRGYFGTLVYLMGEDSHTGRSSRSKGCCQPFVITTILQVVMQYEPYHLCYVEQNIFPVHANCASSL